MLLGFHKYSIYKHHKLPWALLQILSIISHILSNLGFHKNTHHIATLLSHKIIPSLQKAQKHLPCGKNPKGPTKPPTKPVATRHPKARCYTAFLQSPLLHGTLKLVATRHPYKARCYTAIFLQNLTKLKY